MHAKVLREWPGPVSVHSKRVGLSGPLFGNTFFSVANASGRRRRRPFSFQKKISNIPWTHTVHACVCVCDQNKRQTTLAGMDTRDQNRTTPISYVEALYAKGREREKERRGQNTQQNIHAFQSCDVLFRPPDQIPQVSGCAALTNRL